MQLSHPPRIGRTHLRNAARGSVAASLAVLLAASGAVPARIVPCRTGNLSVDYLMARVREEPPPPEALLQELGECGAMGFTGVEDYISWVALEPSPGQPDWAHYDRNEKAVHEAGLRYGIFPWIHFAPQWVWERGDFEPAICAEHGQPTSSPSIWAPSTLRTYDAFYKVLGLHFAKKVDYVGVAMPADYGQVGYPAALANWVVPVHHIHRGYWCGGSYARESFAASMLAKYRRVEVINHMWGAQFATRADIAFPLDQANAVWWSDFAEWYYNSMTNFTVRLVEIARKHFPGVPLTVKVGHASEKVSFGSDYSAIPRMAAKHNFDVSFQTSAPYLAVKRVSSACRFYGVRTIGDPPGPMDGNTFVRRLFNDISAGTDEYLDFPYNFLNMGDLYSEYLPLLSGEDPLCSVALFFPTSQQRLAADTCDQLPRLLQASEVLRDLTDYDVLDERMILDDALVGRHMLLWPEGTVVDEAVFRRVLEWVKYGGEVITWCRGPITRTDGKELAEPGRGAGEFRYRRGRWIVLGGDPGGSEDVFQAMGEKVHAIVQERFPDLLETLPDRERDGILATTFPDRIVLYNGTDSAVEKTVWPAPDGVAFPAVVITLQPHSLSVYRFSR